MRKYRPIPDREYLESVLAYNAETGILTWKTRNASQMRNWRWFNQERAGKAVGTVFTQLSGRKYLVVTIDDITHYVHRIIWKLVTGDNPPEIIDHKDNDGLNNSWTNLRLANYAMNSHNSKTRKDNKLKLKGVRRSKSKDERYTSRIISDGKCIHLGSFETSEAAAMARSIAAKKLHGQFARDE